MMFPSNVRRGVVRQIAVVAMMPSLASVVGAQTSGGGRPPTPPPRTAPTPPPATGVYSPYQGTIISEGVRAYSLPPGAYRLDGSQILPLYGHLPPLPNYDNPDLFGRLGLFGDLPAIYRAQALAGAPGVSVIDLEAARTLGANVMTADAARALESNLYEYHRLADGVYSLNGNAIAYAPGVYGVDVSRDGLGRALDAIRNRDLSRLDARQIQQEVERAAVTMNRAFGNSLSATPPQGWNAQDPADSIYRRARQALTSESYRQAAELFRRIRNSYPQSTYTPDAPYWEAFALSRLGGVTELKQAQEALEWQQARYPRAATRSDAGSLTARIESQLARNGDHAATANLLGVAQTAARSDGCPRDDERIDALNAVTQMDVNGAMPILRKVLTRRESCTQYLRRTAVWIIGMKKMPDAAEILMNVAKTDPDKEIRDQAIFWLANVPSDATVAMLSDFVKSDADIDLRRRAVYSLSRSNTPRAEATLREVALDNNAHIDLRADALQWLMGNPKVDASPLLRDVYARTEDARLRQRLLPAIARQGESARDFLMNVALDSKETVNTRIYAVSYMRTNGGTAAQFATIYDRTQAPEVKQQAISMLGALKDNSGVEKLIEIARNEKDAQLRKAAVAYLTNTKDPRALTVLQEIIDR